MLVGGKLTTESHIGIILGPSLAIFPESVCEGFSSKAIGVLHCRATSSYLHICTSTSSHLDICKSTSSHLHIYIFTSAHLHLLTSHICTSTFSHLHLCTSTSSQLHICRSSILSLFFAFSLKAGAVPPEHHKTRPSEKIVRVEGAKCR